MGTYNITGQTKGFWNNDTPFKDFVQDFDNELFKPSVANTFTTSSSLGIVWGASKLTYINKVRANFTTYLTEFATEESKKLKLEPIVKSKALLDLLMDAQKDLTALRKPELTINGTNVTGIEEKYKVTDGKLGDREEYTVTIDPKADLAKTKLPGVRKHYRFSLSMGLMVSPSVGYNYDVFVPTNLGNNPPATILETVEVEPQLRPSFFFAWHLSRYDVFSKLSRYNWYKRFELNLGMDYRDDKLLDNIYLGAGWSPHRLVHIVGGFRFGEAERLDFDKVNLFGDVETSISNNLKSTWSMRNTSFFLGVNLGLDVIPNAVKLFFN